MSRNDFIRATTGVPLALCCAMMLLGSMRPTAVAVERNLDHVDSRVLFELDLQPILSKAGCNSGACHGKARGQNGFALSLLGFDADFDYGAIVNNARGRRVFPA